MSENEVLLKINLTFSYPGKIERAMAFFVETCGICTLLGTVIQLYRCSLHQYTWTEVNQIEFDNMHHLSQVGNLSTKASVLSTKPLIITAFYSWLILQSRAVGKKDSANHVLNHLDYESVDLCILGFHR